jgi:hypothetical protein
MIRRFVKARSGSPFRVVRASVGTKSKEVSDVARKPPVFRLALITALVLMLALVPAALAAKGGKGGSTGGGGSSSLSLVMVNDQNGNGLPNFGDTVTFNASTTATPEPHVRLQCFQGGALVYSADAGMYASYPWPWEQNMTLSSSWWAGGAADCTARIYYFSGSKTVWAASLSFHVGA